MCLACGAAPTLLDTVIESMDAATVVRKQLVWCRGCGTVRLYRKTTTTEDLGNHEKRYLRAASRESLR